MTEAMSLPIPAAYSLDSYIQTVNRYPLLSLEDEQRLARAWHDAQDVDAARQLVVSHLRVVVSVARHYLGYGLPHADLIQTLMLQNGDVAAVLPNVLYLLGQSLIFFLIAVWRFRTE